MYRLAAVGSGAAAQSVSSYSYLVSTAVGSNLYSIFYLYLLDDCYTTIMYSNILYLPVQYNMMKITTFSIIFAGGAAAPHRPQ